MLKFCYIKKCGMLQYLGEAEYVGDIPTMFGELHAALVLATKATASSFELNASEALVGFIFNLFIMFIVLIVPLLYKQPTPV